MTIYEYRIVTVDRVVDGDTIDCTLSRDLDLGFKVYVSASTTQRLRLLRADTPERGQLGYNEATDYVRDWLRLHPRLVARTEKSDSFGRYLVDIVCLETSANLSDDLIAAGHAVLWTR